MAFDQSFPDSVDWNFPSPNTTPTHNSFRSSIFQTPKTSTFPSHFQDAFTTPQLVGYTTPRLPSQNAPTEPMERTDDPSVPHVYAHHNPSMQFRPYDARMPPPPYLGQTAVPRAQWAESNAQQQTSPLQMTSNELDFTQMQTPPPTRHSDSRKNQHQPSVAFGTPSSIASRRFVTPQRQTNDYASPDGQQQSTSLFPNLQFPSAAAHFTNTGPATAPVLPSSVNFWDTLSSSAPPKQTSLTLDDPFCATSTHPVPTWSSISHPTTSASQNASFDTIAYDDFSVQPLPQHATNTASLLPQSMSTSSLNLVANSGVDPTLLYNVPHQPVLRSESRNSQTRPSLSQSERKRKDVTTVRHARSDTLSSGESVTSRPATMLGRSNTTGSQRRPNTSLPPLSTDPLSRVNSLHRPQRTSSPLKRVGRTPLGSISESFKQKQRASVILTVDETGSARTETLQSDGSPTRSMRARYPGLFDSDSSDEESDDSVTPSSSARSVNLSRTEERKQKAVKLDPPVERFEGLSIPRSMSSASMRNATVTPSRAAVAAAVSLRRHGSARKATPVRRGQDRSSLTTASDTCPMDVGSDQPEPTIDLTSSKPADDWASGLIPTSARPSHSMQSTLEDHNRRWSMMSFDNHYPSHAEQTHNLANPFGGQLPTSHAPQPRAPVRKLRCVCGIPNDQGQSLIQCVLCTQWLHMPCLGLEAYQPAFTCFLCTRPT